MRAFIPIFLHLKSMALASKPAQTAMHLPSGQSSVLLSFVLAAFSLATQPAWSQIPSIALTTHDLPPYSFPTNDGSPNGIAVKVVQCAAKALATPLEINFFPWKRAQELVKRGAADGFFAASQAEQRDGYAVLSATIAPQEWRWYLLKDSKFDPQSEDFKGTARTSSFHGANMQDWLTENGYKVDGNPPNNKSLLAMLRRGRVDTILANRLVMEDLLALTGGDEDVKSYPALNKPLGIYFSKSFLSQQPPDYLARWNRAILSCTSPKVAKPRLEPD